MTGTITITTGARLHLGPLSYRPPVGRHFGGVGVMLDEPGFRLSMRAANRDTATGAGPTAERVRRCVTQYRRMCPRDRQPPPSAVVVDREMPSHNGLGSGTQLGLAIARGLATLAGEADVSTIELARRVGRGRRSAVGIYGFESGGLIVDAGQSAADGIGALACRIAIPHEWRVLLITPPDPDAGLSGEGEEQAFATLGSMPARTTERLCRIVLTELLPAARAAAFESFAEAVSEYGRLVGEFFAPVQGGVFGHPRTDALIRRLRAQGVHGTGQTSWGPTVFAFVPDDASGRKAASTLDAAVDVRVVTLRNTGATLET